MNQRLQKDAAIYSELVSIIERDSDAVYDILEVLISNLNDKQLDIMEDLIVNNISSKKSSSNVYLMSSNRSNSLYLSSEL